MKASELRDKNLEELRKIMQELLQEQFNLRMQSGTGQMARSHLIRDARKNIARVKTIMKENKAAV